MLPFRGEFFSLVQPMGPFECLNKLPTEISVDSKWRCARFAEGAYDSGVLSNPRKHCLGRMRSRLVD